MLAFVIGAVITAGALAFVLLPLLGGTGVGETRPASSPQTGTATPEVESSAIDVLREIEFDRATGKLSESDYESLKATHTARALAELRAARARRGVSGPATANATLSSTGSGHVCTVCGPRPETDALYCSECGRYLAGRCVACGTTVTQPAARFCAECGGTLAA